LIFFAGDLFFAGEQRFGFAEIDIDVAAFLAADGAGHNVTDHVLKVVVNTVLLELAQALHHGLTSRLRGDAAERRRIEFFLNHLSEHSAGFERLGLLEMDFRLGIADRIDDLEQRPSFELAVFGVDLDLQFLP
jgi:hypothetical protein